MKFDRDKVVVITGAGSGIGRALAELLAARGVRLALSDVKLESVQETVARATALGAEARGYALDVADREAVYAHAERVKSDFGRVNAIVNNAGVALSATVEEMSYADFEWVMNIDFWGVVYGTKAFLPHLVASGDGHIVNISSVFGLIGVPSQSAYNAAKFAVRGFTESLRQELTMARHPVGATVVHPGGIRTSIGRNIRAGSEADRKRAANTIDHAFTSAAGAAKAIVRGVERDAARVLIGPDAYVIDGMQRVLGPAYRHLVTPLARLR